MGLCKTESFVRYMSKDEVLRVKSANGLVPSLNRKTGELTRKPRWISRKGSDRPGTSKLNTHKVEFEMKSGTTEWLEKNGVDFDFISGEGAALNKIIIKGNEPGSYGVGRELLEEFNSKIIGKVKVTDLTKIKGK